MNDIIEVEDVSEDEFVSLSQSQPQSSGSEYSPEDESGQESDSQSTDSQVHSTLYGPVDSFYNIYIFNPGPVSAW